MWLLALMILLAFAIVSMPGLAGAADNWAPFWFWMALIGALFAMKQFA